MFDFNLNLTAAADSDEIYDLIIIGGGPAGLTAGLYASRYKLKTLMIEKQYTPGGQLTATEWVENYPGFPEPVLGSKLAKDMEAQAKLFGLQIVNETVTGVELSGAIKQIHTPYAVWQAKTVLITTGASPRKLGVPGEAEFAGKGVSYCATCDGPFYPDKTIAVVGGGNSAFEESLFLAKYARKITLIHRSDSFKADKILQEKVSANPIIDFVTPAAVEEIDFKIATDRKLILRDLKSGELSSLLVDGVFIFVGSIPNTGLFTGQLSLENGYIVTNRDHSTSVEGVWAAGDVQANVLRQVATAVGDGACAAYRIHQYLEERS